MARRRRKANVCKAHQGPEAVSAPALLEEVSPLIRMEREVGEEFREAMRDRLAQKVVTFDAGCSGSSPRCAKCGKATSSRGRRSSSVLTRFGSVLLRPTVYRCRPCKLQVHPLLDRLGVEEGRVSGSLARLLALLGIAVPYELAARLCLLFFGIEVNAMTVWRAVQRLGEACEQYTEAQSQYFGNARAEAEGNADAPAVVVLGVDGSALGMQVRTHRRRRKQGEVLPPLSPIEEGHFREVKTAALLLPKERVELSPGRRSVLQRILVTCLGNADRIFERVWAKLSDLKWLGPDTVVVIVGDGAEWIWNRAKLFTKRCEILDFWHAVEKAWEFARVRYGDNAAQVDKFAHQIAIDLRAGKVTEVIKRLAALRPKEVGPKESLASLIKYYTDNQSRMRYDEYLRLGYGIGSGAVESAHKQLVHARLRQAGMRWSEAGARRLLALRVLLLNGNWELLDRLVMKPIPVAKAA